MNAMAILISYSVLDVDARTWLAKGFGLPVGIKFLPSLYSEVLTIFSEIPTASIFAPFSERFFQYLRQCCTEMILHPTTIPLDHSQKFYGAPDSASRFKFLEQIFKSFKFMLEGNITLTPHHI
jgi:hypothetical protein